MSCTPVETNCHTIHIHKAVSCVWLKAERYWLWRCAVGLCRSWSDLGVGFADFVKRLCLQQPGHKTLRYFRMKQSRISCMKWCKADYEWQCLLIVIGWVCLRAEFQGSVPVDLIPVYSLISLSWTSAPLSGVIIVHYNFKFVVLCLTLACVVMMLSWKEDDSLVSCWYVW